MVGASINDVGKLANVFAQATGSATKPADFGFQQVLDSHTEKNASQKDAVQEVQQKKETSGTDDLKDSNKASDTVSKETDNTKEVEHVSKTKEDSGVNAADEAPKTEGLAGKKLTEEELEKAAMLLQAGAEQLLQEIAALFGISVEELQGMMEQLGMENADLLNPEKLSGLLLEAGGASDSYALLTDSELYANYQEAMQKLDGVLQQVKETLGMDADQALKAVAESQMTESSDDAVNEAQPVVTVEEKFAPENTGDGRQAENPVQDVSHMQGDASKESEAGTMKGNEQEQTRAGEGEAQAGTLFLQNPRTEGFTNQVQQMPVLSANPWDTDTQDIMRQIMDYMKIQIKPEETTLEMQLHPENLGTVHVQLASKAGALTANFITQNEVVKAAVESNVVQLKESFQEQGVKVEAIEVTVQTHEFERNLEQGRGRGRGQEEQHERKRSVRSINLNDSLDFEELSEEEMLEADMMSARGSTVNFSA